MKGRGSSLSFLLGMSIIFCLQACYTQFAFYDEPNSESKTSVAESEAESQSDYPYDINNHRTNKVNKMVIHKYYFNDLDDLPYHWKSTNPEFYIGFQSIFGDSYYDYPYLGKYEIFYHHIKYFEYYVYSGYLYSYSHYNPPYHLVLHYESPELAKGKDKRYSKKTSKRRSREKKKLYAKQKNIVQKKTGKKSTHNQGILLAQKKSDNRKVVPTTDDSKKIKSSETLLTKIANSSKNHKKKTKSKQQKILNSEKKKGKNKKSFLIASHKNAVKLSKKTALQSKPVNKSPRPVISIDRNRSRKPQRKKTSYQLYQFGKISLETLLGHSGGEREENFSREDIFRRRPGRSINQLSDHKTNVRN